jgi:hypothetical protein
LILKSYEAECPGCRRRIRATTESLILHSMKRHARNCREMGLSDSGIEPAIERLPEPAPIAPIGRGFWARLVVLWRSLLRGFAE